MSALSSSEYTEASTLSESSESETAVAAARADSGCWNEASTRACTLARSFLSSAVNSVGTEAGLPDAPTIASISAHSSMPPGIP